MTISKDRRELYPNMAEREVKAIDRAYDECVNALMEAGLNVEGDDRAENLVGAIARYVEDCRWRSSGKRAPS
jgi:hypothetical protein